MFFDINGRGTELYPTVYALWKVPELLPAFILRGGEVSCFIIGGADLMFPGINIPSEGLHSFLAGELWSVKVPGNPAPVAVGTTTMSSTEALKAGLRGKALRITHYYRDSLWESADGSYVPNAGFLKDAVFEDPFLSSTSQNSETCEGDASVAQENCLNNEEVGKGIDITDVRSDSDPVSVTHTDVEKENAEQIITDMGELKVIGNVSTDESNIDDQHSLSIEDVNALLDKCLLQSLHTTVKDKDLPMPGSTLW
ncbi:unnamed protein product [Ilex paraguariensis]|uniref:Eukaryotic translation initiation factor 2D-like PUA RNA-binding domain-containing protein n=1 Tax=Ilex paraguariensis TaxID=185542 RepID=A0ABC8R2I4_9AQUA